MRSEKWNEILNQLDDDIVEEFVKKNEVLEKQSNRRKLLLRITAFAACVCLIISAVVVAPIIDHSAYTANEVAEILDSYAYNSASTNAYEELYVSDSNYLYINAIPESEYLEVYRYKEPKKLLSERELIEFADPLIEKFSAALNQNLPSYTIKDESSIYTEDNTLVASNKFNHGFNYSILQNQYLYRFYISKYTESSDNRTIYLNGEAVQIDQRLTDEEIIASLEGIKSILFDFFGVSFKDVKITRKFDGYSKNGVTWVYIYFYDKDAHPLNLTQDKPVSDYICIDFDNAVNSSSDIVSDDILRTSTIQYYQKRTAPTDSYDVVSKIKRISIEEAEELLYKGYVFGGHSCKLCMSMQEKVSFENYDFVDLEYVFEYVIDPTEASYGIPFYAFYKQIGTAKNGDLIYAKTYVPAIEVRGYEEYFESQTQNHIGS